MEIIIELRNHIFQIIKNQIRNNDPPETKQTFDRLKEAGYSEFESKQLIGQCIAVGLFQIMKYQEPFDEKRYIKHLKNLSKKPFE